MQLPAAIDALLTWRVAAAAVLLAWLAWLTWRVARRDRAVYWLRRDVQSLARQAGWGDNQDVTQARGDPKAMTERIDPEAIRRLINLSK